MTAVRWNEDDIAAITAFENLANVKVIDYLAIDETCYFVVDQPLGAVIGKGGENIKVMQEKLGKNIKVFRYSSDLSGFVQNLFLVPIKKVSFVEKKQGKAVRVSIDNANKAKAMGRGKKNIYIIKEFLRRQFGVVDLKIE